MVRRSGFFVSLFTQLLALVSAFGITINPTTPFDRATALGPPGVSAAAPVGEESLPVRIIQTQLNAVGGIGAGLAVTGDAAIELIFGSQSRGNAGIAQTLVRALDRDGLAGLPGGAAAVAGTAVRFVEGGTNFWINTASLILLSELGLNGLDPRAELLAVDPGFDPALAELPLPERFVRVQVGGVQGIGRALLGATTGVGEALLAIPDVIDATLERGGPGALPAGLAAAAAQVVRAAQTGATRVVTSVADMARAELSLIPGADVNDPKFAVAAIAAEPAPAGEPGSLELVVRVPLAVGVAGSRLVLTVLDATTVVTGSFVQATSDIVRSVTGASLPGGGGPATEAARVVEEPRLTLSEALAKAPVTIRRGFDDAGVVVREGTRRAAEDFNNTLRGRSSEAMQLARTGDETAASLGDDASGVANPEAVRPNKPRPVLNAVKTVTGAVKSVRNGIRSALGLPARNAKSDPPKAEASSTAPASS